MSYKHWPLSWITHGLPYHTEISLTLVSGLQSKLRKKPQKTKGRREFVIVFVLFCWLICPSGSFCGTQRRLVEANPPLTQAIYARSGVEGWGWNQECLQSSRFLNDTVEGKKKSPPRAVKLRKVSGNFLGTSEKRRVAARVRRQKQGKSY